MRPVLVLLLMLACGKEAEEPPALDGGPQPDAQAIQIDAGAPADANPAPDAGAAPDASVDPTQGPIGFIGSPCEVDADCDYEGGVCLTAGFPRGSCSLPCDRLCPDADGFPTTFCVPSSGLPSAPAGLGACISRCSFGLFPETGCRPGYGCRERSRFNEPSTEQLVCVPGEDTDVGGCLGQLAAAGVDFEPTEMPDRSPSGHPNLVCHVEEPVIIHPPIHGVDLKYFDGSPTPNVRAACNMALSLVKTVDDVAARGVIAIRHIGTYNCRVISGTSRLSRHAYADAIDIYGFDFADGSSYTLVDHWEHATMMPSSMAAIFLYETAYRWHDARFWTIILTPNYNAAHDNHFHVDLTPGSDFIQLLPSDDFGYVGPAPYAD